MIITSNAATAPLDIQCHISARFLTSISVCALLYFDMQECEEAKREGEGEGEKEGRRERARERRGRDVEEGKERER